MGNQTDAVKHSTFEATFAERAKNASHPLTSYLLRLMELKQSNLCLSADVTSVRELLNLADKIGPSIVVLKTHYDLVSGWDFHPETGTGAKLGALAKKHGFLIFEDRKFGDIGNTVQLQYTAGTARIIDWAHIVNINMVPGKAGVTALSEAAAKWRSRVNYQVRTSVSVGTPLSEQFDDAEESAEVQAERRESLSPLEAPSSGFYREQDGRKGSIVSVTTVTQSFEPVDSPRFPTGTAQGDELFYAGIEEPPFERGLLILAQMSSKGNFMNAEYTQACVEAARENKDFVMGFISQETLNTESSDSFVCMTPGCQLPPEGQEENGIVDGDGLGQQYNTPTKLVGLCGTDIIIVGRGIIKASSPQAEAERYRNRAWKACDRGLPCANCISRGKESSCRYETGKPVARAHTGPSGERPPEGTSRTERVVDLGYTHQNGASTLDVLRRIDNASDGERLASLAAEQGTSSAGRYKALIRQLPARTYVEDLVGFYFQDINWQYFGIIFRELMAKWYSVPFAVFANGLEPMLREFPALVFEMSAYLFEKFESLKYADMTFDDLAMDYSESGAAILSLLGKRQMTLIAPLAGWFLKNCGMSWHQLGSAIRDAQEIGMHRDEKDPHPGPHDTIEESLEKRIWITLLSWDIHMGSVLGRTPQCDLGTVSVTLPVDVMPSTEGRRMPLIPRPDDTPPTPLTRSIWSFKLIQPLRDIIGLEKQGPFPKDFSHRSLQEMEAQIPAPLRMHNPDTRFDHLPECRWLPLTRPTLPQTLHFGKLALHRPYIFTRASSRLEALKASFGMLEAQKQYFAVLNPSHHRMFSLFYGTFDAHTEMFDEALQHFEWASDRFEKMAGRNQLARSATSVLNTLHMRLKHEPTPAPNSEVSSSSASSGLTSSASSNTSLTPGSSISNIGGKGPLRESGADGQNGGSVANGGSHDIGTGFDIFGSTDWSLPADFDLGSIIPMYPIGDLAMNDLTGFFGDTGSHTTSMGWAATGPAGADLLAFDQPQQIPTNGTHSTIENGGSSAPNVVSNIISGNYETGISGHPAQGRYQSQSGNGDAPWQFGGDFGNDTVWNLFNQIPWPANSASSTTS
ncbi:LOW QUALITY PROTEIN: humps family-domain-containing protein [Microdochium trichocladiopsis]|uniref:Orotidine 5'-phosphate decarboxylase n=1 Tax=Microdochium trichocladiopsis TaxID=1682393 RepID=A0A9P9BKD9_9PEZI|nr:LOW QUALITY PROTEIN: humps family-domain-containing protein [Microdochium trichocladiopsis]KAH7021119.1 LOW QUALITY PROTEIN: humps family-domain-containing protein [Microdochium trichocladiopsis]